MILRVFLIPFSLIYYAVISLRDFLYKINIFKIHSLGAKVISVGNITWGGTGKTPGVLFLLEMLLQKGYKPGVLIRGYGDDEHELISRNAAGVAVMIGKDRVKSGVEAISKYSVDTLVLDDGFQYRRLKRDLDILCIDALNPFGNGLLIPAGSMREGFSALKRADIFLITKVDLLEDKESLKKLEAGLKRHNPKAFIVKSVHKEHSIYKLLNDQLVDIEQLKHKEIALVSAIGSPESFEKTVLGLGLKFKRHFIFRDHHQYTKKELEEIKAYCGRNNIDTVITTEKDAVRFGGIQYPVSSIQFPVSSIELLVLCIKMELTENEQGFYERLFGIYHS